MTLRTTDRRAGFTLIELLVVIGIIILLMGLLLPAVMRVMESGKKADNTARITQTASLIGTFSKGGSEFGSPQYIPAGRIDPNGTIGPFRLRNSYTATSNPDQNSFEAQYLVKVFGQRINLANLGNPAMNADLDANQTLVFFLGGIPQVSGQDVILTGFSPSQQPFAPKTLQDEKRKGPLLEVTSKRYLVAPNRFPWLTDAYGNPYAYFVAFDGKPSQYGGHHPTPPWTTILPYRNGSQFQNPTGFQIISAGKDGRYGANGNWANVDPNGRDDQSNFTKDLLGAGPQ